MIIKHTHSILAAVAAAAIVAGVATAASPASHASLLIRHQVRGCHSWSLNGGQFRAQQAVTLRRGGSITVVDNDVMSHKLVETSGPAARLQAPSMARMGAIAKILYSPRGAMALSRFLSASVPRAATGAQVQAAGRAAALAEVLAAARSAGVDVGGDQQR